MTAPPTRDATAVPRRSRRRWLILGIALAACGGAIAYWIASTPQPIVEPQLGPPWLREVTADSGVHFICRNGEEAGHLTILESLGGGVALFDYDGDGLLDIFVTGGGTFDKARGDYPADPAAYTEAVRKAPPALVGQPCKLYKNLGNFKFQDVTREAGLERPWFYTHGCAVADYDCDGWPEAPARYRLRQDHAVPQRAGRQGRPALRGRDGRRGPGGYVVAD